VVQNVFFKYLKSCFLKRLILQLVIKTVAHTSLMSPRKMPPAVAPETRPARMTSTSSVDTSFSAARRVHTVRFFRPEPQAAHCLAYSAEAAALALARSGGAVEIWRSCATERGMKVRPAAVLAERRVPPAGAEASIEALCWAGWRLFAATTQGLVLELCTQTLRARRQHAVTAGAAWCMSYHPGSRRLAVGTEEGYVCLVEVVPEEEDEELGLRHDRVLDKQEGRILAIDWNSTGDYIVTGSADTIRIWNVQSGHPWQRISTGRLEKNRETIVWSVAFADADTVISGDSRGKTCFWDVRTGTLADAYQTHAADVLSVCVAEDGRTAYSAGVDPTVVHFQPLSKKDGSRRRWLRGIRRSVHTHDVRSLAAGPSGWLFSAGVDAALCVSDPANKSVRRFPPLPLGVNAAVAANAGLLLLRYPTHVELWRLGQPAASTEPERPGSVLPLADEPVKLLQLKTKDEEDVVCASVSSDGQLVSYATPSRIRAYSLDVETDKEKPSIRRLKVSQKEEDQAAHHLLCLEGARLLVITAEGNAEFFALDEDTMKCVATLRRDSLGLTSTVTRTALGPNSLAVLADSTGNAVIVDVVRQVLASKLPAYNAAPPAAVAMTAHNTALLAYADGCVVEAHARNGRYTHFSNATLANSGKRRFAPRGVLALGTSRVAVYDHEAIAIIGGDVESDPANKAAKRRDESSGAGQRKATVKTIKKYAHLAFLAPLNDDTLVAVEVQESTLQAQLPPSLKKKRFGVM